MQTETTKILKEWASVIRALHTQQQIILFRKGGIIERYDEFEVESPEFFLYPTYLHQSPDQLQPDYRHWIAETEQEKPSPKQVKISLYATVEKVLQAKGVERLRDLTETTIWTPEYIEKTWSWKPEKPAYILFLRVYELSTPYLVEEKPAYGGCVSWVDLEEPLAVTGLSPVMDDATFKQRCLEIEAALADTVVPVS